MSAVKLRVKLPAVRTVGVLREIKKGEGRVGVTPEGVAAFRREGKEVVVEHNAGALSGFTDEQYEAAGATINRREYIWGYTDLIVKVKEPLNEEFDLFQARGNNLILFTYLHLASDENLARRTAASGVFGIAYETVQQSDGSIPMLTPMSRIAGVMAPMEAAAIGTPQGARGILMSRQKVLVVGGGVVGSHAASQAANMGANVTVLDISVEKARANLTRIYSASMQEPPYPESVVNLHSEAYRRIRVLPNTDENLVHESGEADTIIGAALRPGAPAPKLFMGDFFRNVRPGCVFVDVAIDQGGMTAFSHPTTHYEPTFIVDRGLNVHQYGDVSTPGTVMYCVANMPGKHASTATIQLTDVTLKYALAISKGLGVAFGQFPELVGGVSTAGGWITHEQVAKPLGLMYMFKPITEFVFDPS